jgi:hypothetical protein
MFTPFFIIAWLCLLLIMKKVFLVLRRGDSDNKGGLRFQEIMHQLLSELRDRVTPLVFVTIITLHTFSMSGAISPFVCKKSNDVLVMVKNPSELCFGVSWTKYSFFIIFFLLLYGLIAPFGVVWLLLKNRSRFKDAEFRKKFGIIIAPYKHQFFYWELVSMYKRAVLISFSQLLSTLDYDVKVSAAVCLLAFFTFVEAVLEPYHSQMSCLRSNA